jgi:hypothetical protein
MKAGQVHFRKVKGIKYNLENNLDIIVNLLIYLVCRQNSVLHVLISKNI